MTDNSIAGVLASELQTGKKKQNKVKGTACGKGMPFYIRKSYK